MRGEDTDCQDAFFGTSEFNDFGLFRSSTSKAISFLSVSPYNVVPATPPSGQAIHIFPPPTPLLVAMFCFQDAIQPGVAAAVGALQSGGWRSAGRPKPGDGKKVVMLTGERVILGSCGKRC